MNGIRQFSLNLTKRCRKIDKENQGLTKGLEYKDEILEKLMAADHGRLNDAFTVVNEKKSTN